MSIIINVNPFEFFTDTQGDALDAGYIWIGEANKDPRQYPVAAFFDSALTIPAAMPLRTVSGYIVRNGTPTFLYIGGTYSVRVEDKKHRPIYYVADFLMSGSGQAANAGDLANFTDPTKGAALIGWTRAAISASITTVHQMLDVQTYNIWEFADQVVTKPVPSDPETWDWTPATEFAIQYAKTRGGGTIEYPAGSFLHTRIIRRHSVSLKGQGSSSTYFTSLPFVPGGSYGYMEIEDGAVSASHMEGIHLMGSAIQGFAQPTVNPTQWGMYIKAKWDAAFTHGGLWYSDHTDVRISNFNYGVWTRGGYTTNNFLRPIQFLKFYQTFIQVPNLGDALRMTGQHGQIDFIGGAAEGRDSVIALRCVTCDYDPDPATMAVNGSGHGESTGDTAGVGSAIQAPLNVTFCNGFSMQKSQQGYYGRIAKAITFENCWIEDIGKCFNLDVSAQVNVTKNHMANAADGNQFSSPLLGYIYSLSGGAAINFADNNNIAGTVDNYLDPATNYNDNRGLNLKGVMSGNPAGKFKSAGFKTLTVTGGALDLQGHKYVIINPNGNPSLLTDTINALAAPGELVFIRPLNGPITLANTGNISLGGVAEFTIPQNGMCTLIRIPQVVGIIEWQLHSCTEHSSATIPTSGYYAADTRIWRRGAGPSASMGWWITTAGVAGSTAVIKTMPLLSA